MPAFGKMSLVTPRFHPSDIAFVRAWSAAAPGFGGWHVSFDREEAPEQVAVAPPGAQEPVFVITRGPRDVVLHRRQDGALAELQRFDGLREAALALCPLADDALEAIQIGLERDFPRHRR